MPESEEVLKGQEDVLKEHSGTLEGAHISQIWNNLNRKENNNNNRSQYTESKKSPWVHNVTQETGEVETALFHRRISAIEVILTLKTHYFVTTKVITDLDEIRSRC